MDGLLFGYAQFQEDVFLLFCHSVVFCAFYSFPAHLLNKCNICHPIGIKAEKTHPSLSPHGCAGNDASDRFWGGEWDIACLFKFNERDARPLLQRWERSDG